MHLGNLILNVLLPSFDPVFLSLSLCRIFLLLNSTFRVSTEPVWGKLKRAVDEMFCVIRLIRAVQRHEQNASERVFLTRSWSLDSAVFSI